MAIVDDFWRDDCPSYEPKVTPKPDHGSLRQDINRLITRTLIGTSTERDNFHVELDKIFPGTSKDT